MTTATVYMPDGTPVPFVMTEKELIQFLRIKSRFPDQTIRRYRQRGLRGIQLGKQVRYRLDDVLDWMSKHQKENPR